MAPAGGEHGLLIIDLTWPLLRHVKTHDLGILLAAETGFRFFDEGDPSVRAPDIAFITKGRADRASVKSFKSFIPITPDLVVEVLSPDDRASAVSAKVQWWLEHGVRAVWIVDPAGETVAAYSPDGTARLYRKTETLPGGEVLPGFTLPLREIFFP